MANTIALRKAYSTMLDEVYKLASLTAVLDGPNELVREGANANEILIPKMSMQGLANYNKQTGYVAGDVTLEYETKKCGYDRGRMFTIDAVDNIETAGVAFGRLSGEFLRTKVVPELDASKSHYGSSGCDPVDYRKSDWEPSSDHVFWRADTGGSGFWDLVGCRIIGRISLPYHFRTGFASDPKRSGIIEHGI